MALTLFILRQLSLQKSGYPLLDLRTFGSRNFTVSMLLMASMMMALVWPLVLAMPFFWAPPLWVAAGMNNPPRQPR